MPFMNEELFKLNLQFFAEPGEETPAEEEQEDKSGGNEPPEDDPNKNKEPTFTQKQVDKMIKDRLAREKKDKEDAVAEAEKLAKMNAEQKREYEFEKLQRENEELKAAQNKYELGKEATKMLAESSITATDEILDFVVREDAEKTGEAVKAFSELVDKIADERMTEKLKGKPPKKQTGQVGTMSKEEIMKVQDTSKRHKLIQENMHLFK
ncbi:DUF4355 domain-containing protein [Oceanobacillus neutriphilus]|uniref:DUF4355 domain-containing protein n=1 Tax=Oceanobacillus neutriphilus TaxID=531815 RepID=A0ABQ2NQP1_9BACI|nr:DUF4355 domain-containing protein [Oceanobacillus neutriphilus]GGP07291.1 hypothetical protein GCM10011346_02690 [Oceanobacillus neutriphilus]